jgi:hypothetical protein
MSATFSLSECKPGYPDIPPSGCLIKLEVARTRIGIGDLIEQEVPML